MNPENPSEEPSRLLLALRRSSLFSSLSDEVLAALEAQLTHLTLISGEVLFREGDPSDSLYIVISGRLLVSQVADDQTERIVDHWRSDIIAGIPDLARHARTPEGDPIPQYLKNSNLRFRQWILDTCFRPYDQDWINYQQEIALRHTSSKKNKVDDVRSTPYVPLRDVLAFIAVMNETIKPYLAAKGHSAEEVDKMHRAWCKSIQLQLALWVGPYTSPGQSPQEW